jgi:hypothetical protein
MFKNNCLESSAEPQHRLVKSFHKIGNLENHPVAFHNHESNYSNLNGRSFRIPDLMTVCITQGVHVKADRRCKIQDNLTVCIAAV